jgi:hypothetical protein
MSNPTDKTDSLEDAVCPLPTDIENFVDDFLETYGAMKSPSTEWSCVIHTCNE